MYQQITVSTVVRNLPSVTGTVTVQILSGGPIRFTLDNSEPTASRGLRKWAGDEFTLTQTQAAKCLMIAEDTDTEVGLHD